MPKSSENQGERGETGGGNPKGLLFSKVCFFVFYMKGLSKEEKINQSISVWRVKELLEQGNGFDVDP